MEWSYGDTVTDRAIFTIQNVKPAQGVEALDSLKS